MLAASAAMKTNWLNRKQTPYELHKYFFIHKNQQSDKEFYVEKFWKLQNCLDTSCCSVHSPLVADKPTAPGDDSDPFADWTEKEPLLSELEATQNWKEIHFVKPAKVRTVFAH